MNFYFLSSLKNYGVFFIPSAVFDAASITPDIGLITRPPIPLAAPSKNPGSPFFYAPWIG